MNRFPEMLCMVALFVVSAEAQVAHATTVRTVALTGHQSPAMPAGTNYILFNNLVVLNDAGKTAFQANDTSGHAIWSEGSGNLALVVRGGQQAPGLPTGVNLGNWYNGFPTGV